MKNHGYLKYAAAMFAVLLFMNLFAGEVGAEEMLQNGSFETYDTGTLVPDNWQVIDGNVEIYTEQAYDGSVSVYSLGGTMIEGVDTPNPPQSGTLAQLVDLSDHTDWNTTNWFSVRLSMAYRVWGVGRMRVYLEYLPAAYNNTTVTADDPAWNGADVQQAWSYFGPRNHARPDNPWYTAVMSSQSGLFGPIPKVRWARLRFVFEVTYKSSSYFEDGPYYIAIDGISLDLEPETPEPPCTDNLLTNPGFESISDYMPANWHLLSGSMTAIGFGNRAPYAGDWYVGNIGGYATANPDPDDPDGLPIDHPNSLQNGSLVQVIDLADLPEWSNAGSVLFRFSGYYISRAVNGVSAVLEYLPESYNESEVNWNDPAWDNDAKTALYTSLATTYGAWAKFESGQGSMFNVRWVRVRLYVDTSHRSGCYLLGEYLGGFDQVCFQAESFVTEALIRNPGFEESEDYVHPDEWHEDPAVGSLNWMAAPPPIPFGYRWLSKLANEEDTIGRVYQVIDLAEQIPGWHGFNPFSGAAIEFDFIRFVLGAWVTNAGGRVAVGLEYLPNSYNAVDGITWDDPAWQASEWTSNGTEFTNAGGDAIDMGSLIEDINGSSPAWREMTHTGWLPRVRWLRLRIDLDVTPAYHPSPLTGIDALNLSAECKQYGPYSNFGHLPEAIFPESANAPDKAVPGWTGPEGDGISGGYTGQTRRNYVNPAFAGFADGVIDYSSSGQYNYNPNFTDPMSITGRPYNDSGWVYQIVTLGDLDLTMLADYFGPMSSGDYHPGEITATFDECPIVNGEGHDFATFENGFVLGWTTDMIFGELAYVEVSSNGVEFIRFPSHSLTPKWPGAYGCFISSGVFGMTGKHVNAYGDQWGTPFDLEWIADHPLVLSGTVDLNDIRYVRQVDIPGGGPADANNQYTGLFYDSYGNPIFDSWVTWGSGGADLDAVGVLNSSATDSDGDHITDYWDNCSQTANDTQYDTDQDGYGNMCDCDLDNDNNVNAADFNILKEAWMSNGPIRIPGEPGQPDEYTDPSENWNADADFDGDNYVNITDFNIMKERWNSSAPFK